MSTETVRSFLDELPNIDENTYYYTPVAVFGYLGYLQGFETELSFPLWILPPEDIVATPLQLVVVTIFIVSLTNSIIEKGETEREKGEKWEKAGFGPKEEDPHWKSGEAILMLGLVLSLLLSVLHLGSVYILYVNELYAETLIGLVISIYQVLVVVGGAATGIAGGVYVFFYILLNKLV